MKTPMLDVARRTLELIFSAFPNRHSHLQDAINLTIGPERWTLEKKKTPQLSSGKGGS